MVITPDVVQNMITMAKFDVDVIEIQVSDKLGATTIGLGLLDEHNRKEDVVPISGFPRCLITDNLQKGIQTQAVCFLTHSFTCL
jgi:hypothetical protein